MVFAEGAAQRVGDFANRGVGFDGPEDGGHEILAAARAAFDFFERRARFRAVAPGAQRLQARPTCARSISGSMRSVGIGLLFVRP